MEATVRHNLMQQLPRREDIAAAQPFSVTIEMPKVVAEEASRLRQACNAGDLLSIIGRYPVRETPALNLIAERLGFQNRKQYEGALRKLAYGRRGGSRVCAGTIWYIASRDHQSITDSGGPACINHNHAS
jgi:hypothetical protein